MNPPQAVQKINPFQRHQSAPVLPTKTLQCCGIGKVMKYGNRQQCTHSKSSLCISTTSNAVSFIQGKSKHVIGFYLYHFSSLIVFSVLGAKVWSVTSGCPSSYCVLFSVAPLVCEHGLSLAWFVCSTLF